MRNVCCMAVIAVTLPAGGLGAQNLSPAAGVGFGTSQAKVAAEYGQPFEKMRVTASDDNARVGVPVGLWEVYHLTAGGNRMYVTMLHFGSGNRDGQNPSTLEIDSVMLEPAGHWTIARILSDQPQLATLCSGGCKVIRTKDAAGRTSVLVTPQVASPENTVLDFEGDSGTIRWKSVSSLDSVASWVYALRSKDFDGHHPNLDREPLGTWQPENGNAK
jgi:hypothetical protein